MIDIESKVVNRVIDAIGNRAEVSSIYVNSPSSFPYISIIESDNYMSYLDNGDEKYATLMYEVNVYANDDLKKSTARNLLKILDKEMYAMNFTRISMTPVPNMEDATIYRLTARYECVTDGTLTYRR